MASGNAPRRSGSGTGGPYPGTKSASATDGAFGTKCRGRSMVKMQPEPGNIAHAQHAAVGLNAAPRDGQAQPQAAFVGTALDEGTNICSASPGGRPPQWSSTSIRMRSAAA